MTMSTTGEPVAKSSCIELKLAFSEAGLYQIEVMRRNMKASSREEVVARAFRELVESYGIVFGTDPIPKALLERFGFAASGNVTTLESKRGIISVFLPAPLNREWIDVLKKKTRKTTVDEGVGLALS